MSRMRPPLTTSMTSPSTTSPDVELLFDLAPGALVLGALLGEDETTVLVLLLENEGLDLVAEGDDVCGIDVLADGQLTRGDDTFGLVADVEEDFVALHLTMVPLTRSPSSKSVIVPSMRACISSSVYSSAR
jgi:hypothetical protein